MNAMQRRWASALVTGGTGFIGRHLLARLAREGITATSLQRRKLPSDSGEVLVADMRTSGELERVLAGRRFDVVFHLAAYGVSPHDRDIQLMQAINTDATASLARFTQRSGSHALVIAGSGSEYDFAGVDTPVDIAHPLQTKSAYGASKAAGNAAALAIAGSAPIGLAIGRLFNVYGPGEAEHRLLPSLTSRLLRNESVDLSAGTQLRDFLHVDDAVAALLALADAAIERQGRDIVNIATGIPVTVRLFAELCANVLGKPHALLRFGALPLRPDEMMFFSGNPQAIRALTNWQPSYQLRDGIAATIETMHGARE